VGQGYDKQLVIVRWEAGGSYFHRWGRDGKYDLRISEVGPSVGD